MQERDFEEQLAELKLEERSARTSRNGLVAETALFTAGLGYCLYVGITQSTPPELNALIATVCASFGSIGAVEIERTQHQLKEIVRRRKHHEKIVAVQKTQ